MKIEKIRFTLEFDGIKSVIDSTLGKETIEKMIMDEVYARFRGNIRTMGEDRFVSGPGKWHLKGRYMLPIERKD